MREVVEDSDVPEEKGWWEWEVYGWEGDMVRLDGKGRGKGTGLGCRVKTR